MERGKLSKKTNRTQMTRMMQIFADKKKIRELKNHN